MRGKFGMLVAAIGLLSTTAWSQEYSPVNLLRTGFSFLQSERLRASVHERHRLAALVARLRDQ